MSIEAMKLARAIEYLSELDNVPSEIIHDLQTIEQAQKPEGYQEPVACGGEQEAPYIGHDCAPYMTDSMKVFCPVCCTKFRAIPPDVQKLLLDAGFEPPFDTPAPQRQPLTDEQISDLWCKVSNTDFVTADTHEFARAIEAAHGIKEKNT